jgi:hypothetical protein
MLKSLQPMLRHKRNNEPTNKKGGVGHMYYDEDALMDSFDKWDSRDKRERFIRRMEHKLYAKEHRR